MTVVALLDLQLKPEVLDRAPAVITELLQATRGFDGSLGVEVTVDVDDPAHYVFVEKWESVEQDDAYRAFRATPEGASGLGELLAGPPTLTRLIVAEGV